MVLCNKEPWKTLTYAPGTLSLWILINFQQKNRINNEGRTTISGYGQAVISPVHTITKNGEENSFSRWVPRHGITKKLASARGSFNFNNDIVRIHKEIICKIESN